LIEEVANQTGLTKKTSREAVDAIISAITNCLGREEKVTLIGFGLFAIPAITTGLVILYYLTMDYYYHEQGEIVFFGRMAEIFSKEGKTNDSYNCHCLCQAREH